MKKITTLISALALTALGWQANAQILNQNAGWPNVNWTLGGTYTAAGLLNDPTLAASFTFDDDAAGNGSVDAINAESPIIDLSAAHAGGETWININGDYTFRTFGGTDLLTLDYWDADGSSWVTLETLAANATASDYQTCANMVAYTSATLNIVAFTPTQLAGFKYRVNYDDVASWEYGFCLNSPTIVSSTPPSCPDPSGLTAMNISALSADLGWTENGTATTWDIEWDTTGFVQGTGTMVTGTTTNPHNITGLSATTTYDFYVRADCGGSTSAWFGPFSFTTPCATFTPNYLEDFTLFTPACWDVADNGTPLTGATGVGTSEWAHTSYLNAGGTNDAAKLNLWNTGTEDWMISPTFDLSAGGWELVINAGVTNYNGTAAEPMGSDDTVQVLLSIDGGATWSAIHTWDASNQPNEIGAQYTIDLSAHTATNTVFAIWGTEGTVDDAEDFDFHIGSFEIRTPPNCPEPSSLSAVVAGITADLSWVENGSAVSWEVEYDTTGFATGTGMSAITGTNPHMLSGLAITTSYDYYVRAICGPGDTSIWAGPFTFVSGVSCPAPTNLSATVTATTADLVWMENGSAIFWEVEYDTTGFVTGTGNASVTGNNPLNITGLTSATSYDFYVRAICGAGDTSVWVGPMNFVTNCTTFTPAYTEDFNAFTPACWSESTDGDLMTGPTAMGSSEWNHTSYLNAGGANDAAKLNLWNLGSSEWMISPTFDLSAGGWELKIEAGVTAYNAATAINMGSDDTVQVAISTDGGATWSAIYTWDVNNQPDELGALYTIDLSAYTGTNNIFAIWGTEGTVDDAEDFDFHVGSFVIDMATAVATSEANNVDLNVYPNPNKGVFTLNVNTTDVQELDIKVMNAQGQVVFAKNNFVNLTNVSEQIDLSNNAKGVYFINVTSDKGVKTHKVVVQ